MLQPTQIPGITYYPQNSPGKTTKDSITFMTRTTDEVGNRISNSKTFNVNTATKKEVDDYLKQQKKQLEGKVQKKGGDVNEIRQAYTKSKIGFTDELIKWLDKIRRSWNKLHPKDKMTELGVQIQSDDWEIMMQSDLKQSGPKIPMDISKIVQYYKKKNADYIQIQSKGLYTITDKLGIRATQFSKAAGGMGAFIKPEILKSGGNKVLRASITLSYAKLPNSNMDLAKPEDAEKFADALNKK